MDALSRHVGAWAGANGFRLMPDDPLSEAGARAEVSLAARGALTEIAYTWSHPDDGEQDGLLVLGRGEAEGEVTGFWGDSWHQSPEPRTLHGTRADGVVSVGCDYGGGWMWTIVVAATDPDVLTLRMENTIPASAATDDKAAGAYPVMIAGLRRA